MNLQIYLGRNGIGLSWVRRLGWGCNFFWGEIHLDWEVKGSHKIFDDQNEGCGGGGYKIFVVEKGGRNFIEAYFLYIWVLIPKNMTAPLAVLD